MDSIALNIAEGAGNLSNKDFAGFLTYSIRPGFECLGCLDIALENNFITGTIHATTLSDIHEIIEILFGLRKQLLGSYCDFTKS